MKGLLGRSAAAAALALSVVVAAASAASLTSPTSPPPLSALESQLTVASMQTHHSYVAVGDNSSFLSVAVSLAYGKRVVLLVAPVSGNNTNASSPPRCTGGNSSSFVCTGQFWSVQSDDYSAGVALQIPFSDPCFPSYVKNMPFTATSPNCSAAAVWAASAFHVAVFAPTEDPLGAGFSLTVTTAQSPPVLIDAVQPYMLLTDTVHLGGVPAAFASLAIRDAQAPPQQLRVDRWCGGMDCGHALAVYVRTCPASACNSTDAQPSPATYYDAMLSVGEDGDNSGTFVLPQGPCATADPGTPCITFLGVLPDCGAPGSGACPGPMSLTLSLSRDGGLSVVPAVCFGAGGGQGACEAEFNGSGVQLAAYLGPVGAGPPSSSSAGGVGPRASAGRGEGGRRADGVQRRTQRRGEAAGSDSFGGTPAWSGPAMMSMTMGPAPAPSGPSAAPFLLSVSACSSAVLVFTCYASYPWSACYYGGGQGGGGGDSPSPSPLAWPHPQQQPYRASYDDFGVTSPAPSSTYTLARNGTASAQLGGWLEVAIVRSDTQVPAQWLVTLAVGASPLLSLPDPLSSAPTVTRSRAGAAPGESWMGVTWDAVTLGPLDGSSPQVPDPSGAFYTAYAFPYPPAPGCDGPLDIFNLDAPCGIDGYVAAASSGALALCLPVSVTVLAPQRGVNFTAAATPGFRGDANYTVAIVARCGFTNMCLMMPGGGTQAVAFIPVVSLAGGATLPSHSAVPTPSASASGSPGPPVPTPYDWEVDALLGLGVAAGTLLLIGGIGWVGLRLRRALRPAAAVDYADGDGGTSAPPPAPQPRGSSRRFRKGGPGPGAGGRRAGPAGEGVGEDGGDLVSGGARRAPTSAGRAAALARPLLAGSRSDGADGAAVGWGEGGDADYDVGALS